MSAERPPCVTQAQIDEAEKLGRKFGLTYLSVDGYAKLAGLIEHVKLTISGGPIEIPDDPKGWRVG